MTTTENTSSTLARALDAMAVGRIVLGAASLAAPTALGRSLGAEPTAELNYMTRVFGGRAVALGASYLMADGGDRTRLQLLALGVDISDTVAGAGHLVRGDTPRTAMAKLVALTGTYAALGAARAWQRTRGR